MAFSSSSRADSAEKLPGLFINASPSWPCAVMGVVVERPDWEDVIVARLFTAVASRSSLSAESSKSETSSLKLGSLLSSTSDSAAVSGSVRSGAWRAAGAQGALIRQVSSVGVPRVFLQGSFAKACQQDELKAGARSCPSDDSSAGSEGKSSSLSIFAVSQAGR